MITTPPGFLLASALFWGYCVDCVWLGLAVGLFLESSRWSKTRFEFQQQNVSSITDICVIAFAVYYYFHLNQEEPGLRAGMAFFAWMPLFFLPAMLAQAFGTRSEFDVRLFFFLTRKRVLSQPEIPGPMINLSWPYAALLLLAACMANKIFILFLPIFGCLTMAGLYSFRSRRFAMASWLLLAGAALLLGFIGQLGIARAQQLLEISSRSWFARMSGLDDGDFVQSSALGSVGTLQNNNAIMLRVHATTPLPKPTYMKTSSYDSLLGDYSWICMDPCTALPCAREISTGEGADDGHALDVWLNLPSGSGYLPLPYSGIRVVDLNARLLQRPALGGLKSLAGPQWLHYGVTLAGTACPESKPRDADLLVPEKFSNTCKSVCREWFTVGMSAHDIIQTLRENFSGFRYTLHLPEVPAGRESLDYFLHDARAGHCEYFATCSALLLRQMAIPARYVTGYVLDEYSTLEHAHIARGRSAHAWVRAWVDGQWITVETTPGGPPEGGLFAPLQDLYSWLNFRMAAWRQSAAGRELVSTLLPYVLALLLIFILWRLRGVRRKTASAPPSHSGNNLAVPADHVHWCSLFQQWFVERQCQRESWESLELWSQRLKHSGRVKDHEHLFTHIVRLANRVAYDTTPLSVAEQQEFGRSVEQWLKSTVGSVGQQPC